MQKTIVFVTSGLPFNGNSINEKSLGGSETALLQVAKTFADRGWHVSVFCDCDIPGTYAGVHYIHNKDFPHAAATLCPEVLVVSRFLEFGLLPTEASIKVLWQHDTLVDHARFMAHVWPFDVLFFLSKFHIQNYVSRVPEVAPFCTETRNGIDLELIEKIRTDTPKVDNKIIYTSRPERGLANLLTNILPKIISQNPNVRLHVANYDISSIVGIPENIKAEIAYCNNLIRNSELSKYIVELGHLTKEQLYREICSAQLLVYPTSFPEISCITAMEAQACGTPIITTKDFALVETVHEGCGILIPGDPQSSTYGDTFASIVLRILGDADYYGELYTNCVNTAPTFSWDGVVAQWEEVFESVWDSRKPEVNIRALIRNNDYVVANLVSESLGLKEQEAVLRKHISTFTQPDRCGVETEKVLAHSRKTKDIFSKIGSTLQSIGCALPEQLIDFACGKIPMGMFFKQAVPSCAVTIVDQDDSILREALTHCTACKLDVHGIVASDLDEFPDNFYDMIFVGDFLDSTIDPIFWLEHFRKKLSEKGLIIFTAHKNVKYARVYNNIEYLWGFTHRHFRLMFSGAEDFHAVSHEEGVSDILDSMGTWICMIGKNGPICMPDIGKLVRYARPYPTLSLSMITKNEEDNISRCLKALAPYVDEIVIADSKSTDDTVAIAERFGAKVKSIDFENFSQARNASLDMCTCDWVLWVDADEVMEGGENLRRYIDTQMFNGHVIRQHQFMLNCPPMYDTPVRTFRRKPSYRFTGRIHEHCEDISVKPYDNAITPVIILTEVNLAHCGYFDEGIRRQKCVRRNLKFLIEDATHNPERRLTWVLAMRDFINVAKWGAEKHQGKILPASSEYEMLLGAITIFRENFADEKDQYYKPSFPMYQAALMLLGKQGLKLPETGSPPFEVAVVHAAGIGGLQEQDVKPEKIWFYDLEEFGAFMENKSKNMCKKLQELGIKDSTFVGIPIDAKSMLSRAYNLVK